ncbi:uncharacterized protein LOC143264663, partial [Megachile rotundata]|uniref:uncharacterized protein LOC143264663 n=1 Tax=Megachile rotundata TaxID=143995 RepID=UPI003FD0F4F7
YLYNKLRYLIRALPPSYSYIGDFIDVEESKIVLPDGLTCNYDTENCFSTTKGFVFWENLFKNPYCEGNKEYMVIFEGQATKITEYFENMESVSYIVASIYENASGCVGLLFFPAASSSHNIIHYSNYDFQLALTGKTTRLCNQLVHLSEHPKLSIAEYDNGFLLKYNKSLVVSNIDLLTYTNSKLLYVVKNMKIQINQFYESISHDRCLTEQRLARTMLSVARLNPLEFVYNYMGGPGYSAITRGEVLYIIKCNPVSVNITKVPGDKC